MAGLPNGVKCVSCLTPFTVLDGAGLTATATRLAFRAWDTVGAFERETSTGAWGECVSDGFFDDVHNTIMPCKSKNDNIYSKKVIHKFVHRQKRWVRQPSLLSSPSQPKT